MGAVVSAADKCGVRIRSGAASLPLSGRDHALEVARPVLGKAAAAVNVALVELESE